MKTSDIVSSAIEVHEFQIKFFLKQNLRGIFWSKVMSNNKRDQGSMKYESTLEAQIEKFVDIIFDSTEIDCNGIGHFDEKGIENIRDRLKAIVDSAPDEIPT